VGTALTPSKAKPSFEYTPPVFKFLDLTTSHVTEAEMNALSAGFSDFDEPHPRVVAHEYGAWLNVWEIDSWVEEEKVFAEAYPNIGACLRRARELGCVWINFDQDGHFETDLRRYEW
jgi:hypothetical protein